jgi:hypothetical protein
MEAGLIFTGRMRIYAPIHRKEWRSADFPGHGAEAPHPASVETNRSYESDGSLYCPENCDAALQIGCLRSVSRDTYPSSWPIHSGSAKLNRSEPDAMATYCLPLIA